MIVNCNRIEKKPSLTSAIRKRRFEEIEQILLSGFDTNKLNKKGALPLHVAIEVGEIKIVALLLRIGKADPLKSTKEGKTAFHLASLSGRVDMLNLLQNHATSSDWVQKKDKFGRRPIDLAKKSVTRHWLQKQQQFPLKSDEISELQIKKISTPSQRGSSKPLSHQSTMIQMELLQKQGRVQLLEEQADLKLKSGEYSSSVQMINLALGMCRCNSTDETRLYESLMKIEYLFLKEKIKREPSHLLHPTILKDQLSRLRHQMELDLNKKRPVSQIQKSYTEGAMILLRNLLSVSISNMGTKPPCPFAVICAGSMARLEMASHSDVEFVILIESSTPDNLSYFRTISEILSMKTLLLGETKFTLQLKKEKLSIKGGFSLDAGGISPLGKPGQYELIGTPKELARFQKPSWIASRGHSGEIILVNALTTTRRVIGDQKLYKAYRREVKAILTPQVRAERSHHLLDGHLRDFEPRLDQKTIARREFDIKKDLYRLLQAVVSVLALHYGIEESTTRLRIERLRMRGLLNQQGAERLRKIFDSISRLRLQAHLFYGEEKETLSSGSDPTLYPITKEIEEELTAIYQTLVPLYKATKSFLENGEESSFSSSTLFDREIGAFDWKRAEQGNMKLKCMLSGALAHVALHPQDVDALARLSILQAQVGDSEGALENGNRALQKLGKKASATRANALLAVGVAARKLKLNERARQSLTQAAEMYERLFGSESKYVARALLELSQTHAEAGEMDRYSKTLKTSIELINPLDQQGSESELLSLLSHNNNWEQSLERMHQRSLSHLKDNLGQEPIKAADALIYLADLDLMAFKGQAAKEKLDKALAVYNKNCKLELHSNRLTALALLSRAYELLGNKSEAMKVAQEGKKCGFKKYGDETPLQKAAFVKNLLQVGRLHSSEGQYTLAIKSLQWAQKEAKKLNEQLRFDADPGGVTILHQLGKAHFEIGQTSIGINCLSQGIRKGQELSLEKSPYSSNLLSLYIDLGAMYNKTEQFSHARTTLQKGLQLARALYGTKATQRLVTLLMNLGTASFALEELADAASSYREALKMSNQLGGKQHRFDRATLLQQLGDVHYSAYEFAQASTDYAQASELFKTIGLPKEQARALSGQGVSLSNLDQASKGVLLCKKALSLLSSQEEDLVLASVLSGLGCVYMKLNEWGKARDNLARAYKIGSKSLGSNHPFVIETQENLDLATVGNLAD